MLTWLVTGASRGLGAQIARVALEHGDNVIAGARSAGLSIRSDGTDGKLLPVHLDVTDPDSIKSAVTAGMRHFRRIDVVVNNAGRHLRGAVEEISDTEGRALFDVNVFGPLNVIRAVLPHLREQRSGHIINVGSMSGFRGTPGAGLYAATKFAIEGLTEALAREVEGLGIRATVVEPGALRTDFLDSSSLVDAAHNIKDYEATPAGSSHRAWVQRTNHTQAGDPRKAAEVIYSAATADRAPLHLPIGQDAIAALDGKCTEVLEDLDDWRVRASAIGFD
jgi:NAD(P)-dependent dehydrogenase (short-subunit alcohol dehydrogenase family)